MYFAISFHVICHVLFILQYTKVLKESITQIIESNKTHNNMIVMRVAKEEKRGTGIGILHCGFIFKNIEKCFWEFLVNNSQLNCYKKNLYTFKS